MKGAERHWRDCGTDDTLKVVEKTTPPKTCFLFVSQKWRSCEGKHGGD